ncbi:MAG TPA: sugar transferase [Crocinitomicaceae bacterium]|nr:sugar transferase [Crocinitomicaceae bacterium]
MKRIFDIIASLIILTFFLPFGIIISLAILFSSKGGVFYIQQRIGKNKKPFGLFKFRTMKPDSDKKGQLTVGKDNRITKVGSVLRKYKLDEFPQFLNVLFGQMSIVGPRPEVKEFVDLYTEEQLGILQVKPGITDLASLEYFEENTLLGRAEDPRKTYVEEIMPAKIALNKKYLENPTIGNDLKIMWRTALKIMF